MTEPSQKQAGLLLTAYYAGRIHGRAPTLSLENLISRQLNTFAMSEFESEAKRCAVGLSEEGKEITEIGKAIAAQEKKF
jgi:hypothetical protein